MTGILKKITDVNGIVFQISNKGYSNESFNVELPTSKGVYHLQFWIRNDQNRKIVLYDSSWNKVWEI